MKTIKAKILTLALALLMVSMSVVGIYAIQALYNSTLYALEEAMMSTIHATSDMVVAQIESYTETTKQLAIDPIISQELPREGELTADGRTRQEVEDEMLAYFEEIKAIHNFESVQVFDSQGNTVYLDLNESEAPYFAVPRDTGEVYVTDPLLSPETGMLTMVVAAPIFNDANNFQGVVLIAINPTVFSEITSQVEVGEGATTTIISSAGNTIAFNDPQLVFDSYNTIEEAKVDPTLVPLAEVEQKLINGEEGFQSVSWDGMNQFIAYSGIKESNGWGIYILTPENNFLAQMNSSIITIIILGAIIFAVSVVVIIRAANKISKPIVLCADRLTMLAQGDLKTPVPEIKEKDETGILAKATEDIVHNLGTIIGDLNTNLAKIAHGNFAVESSAKEYYVGDFTSLATSSKMIVERLSETMKKINDVSQQVNAGNAIVSEGAQSLAQGSIEQASSIDQLYQTMDKIGEIVRNTAENSQTAKESNDKSQAALGQSNQQMQQMVEAMDNISKKSTEISNIIKAIDDIAFQTNILALNAAVEAARAGSAGKGFAVVADEVRTLATKSAQSAKDTADLIEETVAAVKVGNKIAKETSKSISVAIENADVLSGLVDGIADSSQIQAMSAQQITAGIEQISAVIQTNTATAEQNAATSEELAGQSHILNELLSEFTLRDDNIVKEVRALPNDEKQLLGQ